MHQTATASIRRARPEEAGALAELAPRSKAHWGYDSAFLDDCQESLAVSPDEVAACPFFVAESEGRLLGFYGLVRLATAADLAFLFVEPLAIGLGIGRLLFEHAAESARELGADQLVIESDPFAEGFYLAMGAERVAEIESPIRPGRMLPILRYALSARGDSS